MNWQDPRSSGVAPGIHSLGAGLVFVVGLAGWATPADQPNQSFPSSQFLVTGAVAPRGDVDSGTTTLGAGRSDGPAAKDQSPRAPFRANGHRPGNRDATSTARDTIPKAEDRVPKADDTVDVTKGRAQATGNAPALASPTGDAAPEVEVRVGDHREFERVVFEWPQAVEHDVVHREDRVTIAFGRQGRIDLSRLQDRFGQRVVEARAEGDASSEVVLRVVPNARIRSFSLEDERIVVVDVFGGSASSAPAPPAPQPKVRRTQTASAEYPVRAQLPGSGTRALSRVSDAPIPEAAGAAPEVEVRTGDHGAFERVVFEWPEAVEHDVVHRGDQVVVAFGRPGRIDLARVRGFGRRVLEAWADGGPITRRVVLRVSRDASIRAFSLENGRIVVIDVSGGTAPRNLAARAPDPEWDSVPELRRALEQRDAVIADLLARVEHLEREAVLSSAELDQVAAGGIGAVASAGDARLPPPAAQATTVAQAPATESTSSSSAPIAQDTSAEAAASQDHGDGGANAAAKPGEFEVVEEEIDRALERTLVQTGVLLLPLGQAEVEPFFSYTREETGVPAVAFMDSGLPVGAEIDVRRDEFVSGQALRFGMPFDSQVEFDMPYRFVNQSTVTTVGFGERSAMDHFGHGMGDLSIGLAKTLVRENGHWWPDLIGRIAWDTDTGETTSNGVALGGGFNELRGSLSAVKRQDPLAFVGGVSYETTFENDNIKPGDALGVSIGTVLAASPGTSLRLGLDQTFVNNSQFDGEGIDGSDQVVGMATFGASVVLGRGVLLDVAADIGLTDDAPDYAARASLPIRFNLPIY